MMDLTNGLPELGRINEGFTRSGTHTKEYNMWLIERQAPTPQEKEIIESVPFMQGHYDFSMILGGRVYENRPLIYVFELLDRNYTSRKSIQTSIENWLMRGGHEPLYDDHAENYHYIAKCTSVDVADAYSGLTITIEFEAYPFKIGDLLEGNDIWDTFNFELDVAQITEFEISGTKSIVLYNAGNNMINPQIKASSDFEISKGNQTFIVPAGTSESHDFMLNTGENNLTITGNGTIEFLFYKELL